MMRYFLVIAIISTFFACSKSDIDVADPGYDYFPYEQGHFVVYKYFEIFYDDFTQKVDTLEFELKEQIDSVYIDGEGNSRFALKRYTRAADTLAWVIKDVWSVYRDATHAERSEENVTFVKMAFPLNPVKQWDGNSRNSLGSETYTILNYDLPWTLEGNAFARTMHILHRNNVNLIEEKFAEEVYAYAIGLILKRDVELKKDADGNITAGYDISQTFILFGKE